MGTAKQARAEAYEATKPSPDRGAAQEFLCATGLSASESAVPDWQQSQLLSTIAQWLDSARDPLSSP